jgi:biopolymer transport protein ExbB/TolQ
VDPSTAATVVDPAGHISILPLVMNADPVVKAVMLGLALASIACWAIILEKAVRLFRLSRDVKRLEATAKGAKSPSRGLVHKLLLAAEDEQSHGSHGEGRSEVRGRLERAMRATMRSELHRLEVGLPFLATIGSAGPFIGLFGTVWGIMHSFTAIAAQKDTSLAVVAPGIAEALFATALGLAAAIPAVVAYNAISVQLGRAANRGTTAIGNLAKLFVNGGPSTTAGVA